MPPADVRRAGHPEKRGDELGVVTTFEGDAVVRAVLRRGGIDRRVANDPADAAEDAGWLEGHQADPFRG